MSSSRESSVGGHQDSDEDSGEHEVSTKDMLKSLMESSSEDEEPVSSKKDNERNKGSTSNGGGRTRKPVKC